MVSRIPGTSPGRSLLGYSWSNEISCGQPIKPWKRNPSCTHLRRNHHHHRIDGHRYYRTLPRHSGLLEVSPYLAEEFQIESTTGEWCGQTTHLPTHNALCELPSWLINECSERPSTHFSFLLIRKLSVPAAFFRMLSLIPIFVKKLRCIWSQILSIDESCASLIQL